jgi:hypothetical protein
LALLTSEASNMPAGRTGTEETNWRLARKKGYRVVMAVVMAVVIMMVIDDIDNKIND